jgi:hypothetical protein
MTDWLESCGSAFSCRPVISIIIIIIILVIDGFLDKLVEHMGKVFNKNCRFPICIEICRQVATLF